MSQSPFIAFIFFEKRNRWFVYIAIIAAIGQFCIFKLLYPFPDFFPDSSHYVYAASANWDINIFPIGYSKFLLVFHQLTHSDIALVAFQYFFLEISCLYLFLTVLYFFSPGRAIQNILFIFFFFDPLFIYLSNHITTDTLFAALSVCWLTELLWIIHKPKLYQLLTQAVLLFFCFTIRNNAYYYPIISIVTLTLSKQALKWKLVGMALSFIFIVPFIIHTQNAGEELTGTKQFSLFTGWQLANNALYMYRHIQIDTTQLPSVPSHELDQISRRVFNHVVPNFDAILSEYEANFFIKEEKAPLKKYFFMHYHPKTEYESARDWGAVSVIFEEYGSWLIKHYPIAFVRYFMLPNIKNFIFPPLEELRGYNNNETRIIPVIQDWFDYKTPDISAVSWTMQGKILSIYPFIFGFMNISLVGSLIWLLVKRQKLLIRCEFKYTLIIAMTFVVLNFLFCVFTTIIVLRYQFFPMIVTLIFPLLLIELLDKRENTSESANTNPIKKEIIPELIKLNKISISK